MTATSSLLSVPIVCIILDYACIYSVTVYNVQICIYLPEIASTNDRYNNCMHSERLVYSQNVVMITGQW